MNTSGMVTARIEAYLRGAIDEAREVGKLPAIETADLGIEKSRLEGSDYSSTLPMRIARAVGAAPRAIAEAIVGSASDSPMLASVEVAGPGFINFVLADSWLTGQVDRMQHGAGPCRAAAGRWRTRSDRVRKHQPDRPSYGRPRQDCRFRRRAGAIARGGRLRPAARVLRKRLRQPGQTARTEHLLALRRQAGEDAPFPLNGYKGKYVEEWAQEIAAEVGRKYADLTESEAVDALSAEGVSRSLAMIRTDLDKLQISFDNWFSEDSFTRPVTYGALSTCCAKAAT